MPLNKKQTIKKELVEYKSHIHDSTYDYVALVVE